MTQRCAFSHQHTQSKVLTALISFLIIYRGENAVWTNQLFTFFWCNCVWLCLIVWLPRNMLCSRVPLLSAPLLTLRLSQKALGSTRWWKNKLYCRSVSFGTYCMYSSNGCGVQPQPLCRDLKLISWRSRKAHLHPGLPDWAGKSGPNLATLLTRTKQGDKKGAKSNKRRPNWI